MWKRLAELRTGVWVERVPTELNIADDPSCVLMQQAFVLLHCVYFLYDREDYRLLGMMRRPALRRGAFGPRLLVASDVGEPFFACSKS